MKNLKKLMVLILMTALIYSVSSCVALVNKTHTHDNGLHKGWYKEKRIPRDIYKKTYDNPSRENKRKDKLKSNKK